MHRHLYTAGFLYLLSLPNLLLARDPDHPISSFTNPPARAFSHDTTTRAQKDPEHTINSFPNLPARLFFFDDTTTVTAVYHDSVEGNIYLSFDEGKTWSSPEDIPRGAAVMVIEHPFHNSYAFVLTRGTTHYRTADRGRTWRTFAMPIAPALVQWPLSFHSNNYGYILYQGTACDKSGWGAICHDETYYTTDAFGSPPQPLLSETSRCQFAHSSVDFKHEAHSDLIYYFFRSDKRVEELGIGKNAQGVFAFVIVSKYAVVALKDLTPTGDGDMLLYVTVDTKTWAKAQFPHASSAKLRENAYTLVESTHSLAIDVAQQGQGAIGTLFVSNSNGTFFVQSLKDTNRNEIGFVDYERIYGIEDIGIANVVMNVDEVEGRGEPKQFKSLITFDDGSTWQPLRAPARNSAGQRVPCDPTDTENCFLHLHSVTNPHNFGRIFSSPAPGFVMGVGSIGNSLLPYEECDTFLSTDGGVNWKMIRMDAHKYEFGDSGSIIVLVNDEEGVDEVRYSLDLGNTWKFYKLGVKMRPRALITLPDSTSQKFILLGQVARKDQTDKIGRFVTVSLDFANTRKRKCEADDFERWYARSAKTQCLMGHKQWYNRRKPEVDCYVGEKFTDPVVHEDLCPCKDVDYECDYNFVRDGDKCVAVGPEPIPAGSCTSPEQSYWGSSGYRKVPGNTCIGGKKDAPVSKKCPNARPAPGDIVHQTFQFPSQIVQHAYFRDSSTILVRLEDHSIWQSRNEGYTWDQKFPEERFLAFYHHKYTADRAYLITNTEKFYTTTDSGRTWIALDAPTPPNTFRAQIFRFHPNSDWLIWTGNKYCDEPLARNCHAEAQYSRDNGRHWTFVENYVVNCAWRKDIKLDADPTEIMCESYQVKSGSQRLFQGDNPLALVEGSSYFTKKKKLFDQVVGFAKFFGILGRCRALGKMDPQRRGLDLQVSLDGVKFAPAMFPPNMHPETHAFTILESSTGSLFLHMTMSEPSNPYWGNILKSNYNGTYFGLSIENVNRDERGFVDFEKMIGLNGIALTNVVVNPDEAVLTGRKVLQTRITRDDGGTWKPLTPPWKDSLGNEYDCQRTSCALHIHGYTERADPRIDYTSPSIVGVLIAAGNVGEYLGPYDQSDTFLSRDAGITWEEIHKGTHLWEFGDSGSILVLANDAEPTDHVLYSTDEGLSWREYRFTNEKMRVHSIMTVPSYTSRRFILEAVVPHSAVSTVVQLDFSSLTNRQCVIRIDDPGHDDFELWSPSEEIQDQCLFGRQTLYHRRVRETNCVVGLQPKVQERIIRNCLCTKADFECEFNYFKNEADECVLFPGTTPLPNDPDNWCQQGEDYWYERTAYRKISYSSCEGGEQLDLGPRHYCRSESSGPSGCIWLAVLILILLAVIAAWRHHNRRRVRGAIFLLEDAD
ncbi:Sortilin [Mycena sanguinolenta]|uniref:Vacuolar protein sorting/targeting protein 10 n=1 Tax=Mycena sanguinolenta TaxID=230812 RepID=A0A8H6XZJ2_9AGAR|nr:Sortilin [Mycena sanguinolenta]